MKESNKENKTPTIDPTNINNSIVENNFNIVLNLKNNFKSKHQIKSSTSKKILNLNEKLLNNNEKKENFDFYKNYFIKETANLNINNDCEDFRLLTSNSINLQDKNILKLNDRLNLNKINIEIKTIENKKSYEKKFELNGEINFKSSKSLPKSKKIYEINKLNENNLYAQKNHNILRLYYKKFEESQFQNNNKSNSNRKSLKNCNGISKNKNNYHKENSNNSSNKKSLKDNIEKNTVKS